MENNNYSVRVEEMTVLGPAHFATLPFPAEPNGDDILAALSDEGVLDLENFDFEDYTILPRDENSFYIRILGKRVYIATVASLL